MSRTLDKLNLDLLPTEIHALEIVSVLFIVSWLVGALIHAASWGKFFQYLRTSAVTGVVLLICFAVFKYLMKNALGATAE